MSHIAASSQTWVLDGASASTGSPPLPGTVEGIPSNYYIVIDSITASIVANGSEVVGVTLAADDGQALIKLQKTFQAGEADSFHVTFPKGLVLPKLTRALGTQGRIGTFKNAVYTNAALFTAVGAPTENTISVNYRYVAPAAIGW